jgi:hypothetical protein
MPNLCSQTITLHNREKEKIAEVFKYISENETKRWNDKQFSTKAFPDIEFTWALCSLDEDHNKMHLETKWAPYPLAEISNRFPDVGFHSVSFTDGEGVEEEAYLIDGKIIYEDYFQVGNGMYWEEKTGSKLWKWLKVNYRSKLKKENL